MRRVAPPGEGRELRGVSIAAAGVTFQMFNAAHSPYPDRWPRKPSFPSASCCPPCILTSGDSSGPIGYVKTGWSLKPGDVRGSFEHHGMRHSVDLPGMVAEQVRPVEKNLPKVEVRRVCDHPTRDAFCSIGSVCFHVPIASFREVFDCDSVWENFAGYVGYVNHEPVSTTAIVMGGGAIGCITLLRCRESNGAGMARL